MADKDSGAGGEDLDEARQLLRRRSDEKSPGQQYKARMAAADRLLGSIVAMKDVGNFQLGEEDAQTDLRSIAIVLGPVGGNITYSTKMGFTVLVGGRRIPVQLDYNAAADRFESGEVDTDIAPTPGSRLPRRGPATVLIATFLKAFESKP